MDVSETIAACDLKLIELMTLTLAQGSMRRRYSSVSDGLAGPFAVIACIVILLL